MAKTTKTKRNPTNVFDKDEDLKFFYEEILLFVESDRTSYGDATILKNASKTAGTSVAIDFIYDNYEKEVQTPAENIVYFSAAAEKQTSKRKNTAIVKKMFKHLRNAFAHNLITKENGLYVLRDYYYQESKKSYKLVLYAKLSSLDDFNLKSATNSHAD